jgi:hypothetical protein
MSDAALAPASDETASPNSGESRSIVNTFWANATIRWKSAKFDEGKLVGIHFDIQRRP